MSLSIRSYLQAKQLVYLKVTGGTVNSSGTLVFATGDTLDISQAGLGRFVSFEAIPRQQLFQTMNSDSYIDNNVIERIGWDATIRELISSNILSAIQQVVAGFSYVRVEAAYSNEWTPGTAVVKTAVAGVWENGGGLGVQQGQNVGELTIKPAGVATGGGTGFFIGLAGATIPF
jgi:hypothetical protein